ncbi:MAG: sulfatase-like hydrolase/transferase, partial [Bdellovibrionota bacterium]
MSEIGSRISTLVPRVALCASFALFGVLSGCSWRSAPQMSILVIAVDDLGFGAMSCGEGESQTEVSGFESFCNEAVRFTHAYAPSSLGQATFASLVTGLYPLEHGVRHNGAQGLSAKLVTLPEVAHAKKMKTSLFSGGPPIWRRGGFNQGFDVFDDSVAVNLKTTYRPSNQIVDLFLSWQANEAPRGGFVSFLFMPDPHYVDQPTTNSLGEIRENSYQSQIEEVGESVSRLVKELKARKVWDSTYVFLIGLDGNAQANRMDETQGTNLFSETTRSTLMIKPGRKAREGPYTWKIDQNISLVDVGATLFDIVDEETVRPTSKFETISLMAAFEGSHTGWSETRKIVSETAWPQWRGIGGVRAALRSGPYLYLFDDNDQLFNTLTDSFETTPLPLGEPRSASLRDAFAASLRRLGYLPWKTTNPLAIEKATLAQELWRERGPIADSQERLKKLSRRFPKDPELTAWRAILALQAGRWNDLKAVAGDEHPVWKYVAAVNLGEKAERPFAPCLRALDVPTPEVRKSCNDDLARAIGEWATTKDEKRRDRAMEAALRASTSKALAEK